MDAVYLISADRTAHSTDKQRTSANSDLTDDLIHGPVAPSRLAGLLHAVKTVGVPSRSNLARRVHCGWSDVSLAGDSVRP